MILSEITFTKTWTVFASLPKGFWPTEGLSFQLYQSGGDIANAIVRIGKSGEINGYARDMTTGYSGVITYFTAS